MIIKLIIIIVKSDVSLHIYINRHAIWKKKKKLKTKYACLLETIIILRMGVVNTHTF